MGGTGVTLRGTKEVADFSVELLRGLDATDMADTGQDDQPGSGYRYRERSLNVAVAIQQQGGKVDTAKNITQIRLGRGGHHRTERRG
jgi:hypothetical protein